jgi:Zn finger protein HypA/HybF involved in hydrogenase expression
MEKYGVACGCAQGAPKMGEMTKLANGDLKCPHCGARFGNVKLADKVELKENEKAPAQKR